MNTAGFLVMIVSIGTVTFLLAWSIYKVLTTPGETEHLHAFEQETPDTIPKPDPSPPENDPRP